MRRKWLTGFVVLCLGAALVGLYPWHKAGAEILLWPNGAPGALGNAPEDQPGLDAFLPPAGKANGTAIIVAAGGGYTQLNLPYEGRIIAQWLNRQGIAAFVLHYRLAPRYRYPAALQDTLRAVRLLRTHAADYGIKPERIGILGFSAGGHLAALAATQFGFDPGPSRDAVDAASARPDFAIIGYPVITMLRPFAHEGVVAALLGPSAGDELRSKASAELHATSAASPVFMFQTADDKIIASENSVLFYSALKAAGASAELHIFAHGPHGMGLADGTEGGFNDPMLAIWKTLAMNWLQRLGMLGAH